MVARKSFRKPSNFDTHSLQKSKMLLLTCSSRDMLNLINLKFSHEIKACKDVSCDLFCLPNLSVPGTKP